LLKGDFGWFLFWAQTSPNPHNQLFASPSDPICHGLQNTKPFFQVGKQVYLGRECTCGRIGNGKICGESFKILWREFKFSN
jgi:hypothetical protein